MTTTTTLEKAFQSLKLLPQDMQEELGQNLLSYAAQWQELKANINQGTAELARGEGVEIVDIDAFVDQIKTKHGHS